MLYLPRRLNIWVLTKTDLVGLQIYEYFLQAVLARAKSEGFKCLPEHVLKAETTRKKGLHGTEVKCKVCGDWVEQ